RGTIHIRTYQTDQHVVCQISDDGPGIQPEHMAKIFQPFFTTKPAGKGTGLGLSLSHEIVVNKHKGQLLVDSSPGAGATFTILLPKVQEPSCRSEAVKEVQYNG
ncbi:MAG: ATP-binding protein, partial [Sedimentisphaerales bacterium]|nr:ATP-binding protein [Sedimentisphaerales bacterium]